MSEPNVSVPPAVAQSKQFRRDLDEVLQRLKAASGVIPPPLPDLPVRKSRERSLAITKVEEAIMWLGMDLKAQDTPDPYPQSRNPQSPVIEKTADGLKL